MLGDDSALRKEPGVTETAGLCCVVLCCVTQVGHFVRVGTGAGRGQGRTRNFVTYLLFCHLQEKCVVMAAFPESRTIICVLKVTGEHLRDRVVSHSLGCLVLFKTQGQRCMSLRGCLWFVSVCFAWFCVFFGRTTLFM